MSETPPLHADKSVAGLPRDDEGLSPQRRAFADAAIELINGGEKQWRGKAAAAAGYACPKDAAYICIRDPAVVNYITKRLTAAAQEVNVDRKFVLFRAVTNMIACEASGDYRTAHRYLETIARHCDVSAFNPAAVAADTAGRASFPFDIARLETKDIELLAGIVRKAGGGPSE